MSDPSNLQALRASATQNGQSEARPNLTLPRDTRGGEDSLTAANLHQRKDLDKPPNGCGMVPLQSHQDFGANLEDQLRSAGKGPQPDVVESLQHSLDDQNKILSGNKRLFN